MLLVHLERQAVGEVVGHLDQGEVVGHRSGHREGVEAHRDQGVVEVQVAVVHSNLAVVGVQEDRVGDLVEGDLAGIWLEEGTLLSNSLPIPTLAHLSVASSPQTLAAHFRVAIRPIGPNFSQVL